MELELVAPERFVAERVESEDAPPFFDHALRVLRDRRVEWGSGGRGCLRRRRGLSQGYGGDGDEHSRRGDNQNSDGASHWTSLPARTVDRIGRCASRAVC